MIVYSGIDIIIIELLSENDFANKIYKGTERIIREKSDNIYQNSDNNL